MIARTPIVILGAGPAGLGAALRLARRGFDVTVVERNTAVGGNAPGRFNSESMTSVTWETQNGGTHTVVVLVSSSIPAVAGEHENGGHAADPRERNRNVFTAFDA